MDEQYYADRAQLRHLMQTQPTLSIREQMTVIGRSRSWVKKWRKRLREAPPGDKQVLHGHSRAPRCPPAKVSEVVVQRILAIRDQPPSHLQRIPGPKAILHDLHQDAVLAVFEVLPRAPSTIWRILRRHGRIPPKLKRLHEPLPRPVPMSQWQVDFKDISTVKPDPEGDGKRQHVVEALNLVDAGTSILVDYRLRADFNAATVIETMVECLQAHGLPQAVTFDRDPLCWLPHTSVRKSGVLTAR